VLALDQRRLRREREQAEEAMRQSEHKYRHLFESLSEAAFLIEISSRRVVDANLCAQDLLGRTRTEILGMDESALFPHERSRRVLPQAHERRHGGGPEPHGRSGRGGERRPAHPVQISVAPIELYAAS